MKKLLEEQLMDYEAAFDANKQEAIRLMKAGEKWEHLAKEGAGIKMMIDHVKLELEKFDSKTI